MEITYAVKNLIMVYLIGLSPFYANASFYSTLISTKSRQKNGTKPSNTATPYSNNNGTTFKKYYYIDLYIVNYCWSRANVRSNLTKGISGHGLPAQIHPGWRIRFQAKFDHPKTFYVQMQEVGSWRWLLVNNLKSLIIVASTIRKQRRINITKPITTIVTEATIKSTTVSTIRSTTAEATVKNDSSTTLSTITDTSEASHNITTSNAVRDNITAQNAYKHHENEHRLMFYISVGIGSLFATLLFSLIIILIRRSIRKKKENKKRANYWSRINRACQSQYVANEEVSSNNPMYEGSRSRTTSNVLYGVPEEQEDVGSKTSGTNDYVLTPSIQPAPKPNVVISNACAGCALYQNTDDDDLYTEPGKVPGDVENANYERIRSFIHYENSVVTQSTGSYAEPCVLFNGIFISEKAGYVSVACKPK